MKKQRTSKEELIQELKLLENEADKIKRQLIVTVSPKLNESRKRIGTFGTFQDASDRVVAMKALKESEVKFRLLAETTAQLFLSTGAENFYM